MMQEMTKDDLLIMVNRDKRFWSDYDQVIYLSAKDKANLRTVYSQYGMTYFFDILYSHYVQRYRSKDLLQGPVDEPGLSDSQKMRVKRCTE